MVDFNDMISNFLKRELRGKEIGRYYPSEAGSCLRKTWYSYKIPKEVDSELIKVFQAGNMIHDFVVDVIKSEKNPDVELVSTEEPFRIEIDGIVVSGRIDDIILLKIEGKKYIVEVKSTAGLRYIDEERINQGHIYQIQLYMHHTGIHNGIILYVEKNTLQSQAIEINYNKEIAEEAIKRLKFIHEKLVNNHIPEPEARTNPEMKWQCRNCHFRDECSQETPEEELP